MTAHNSNDYLTIKTMIMIMTASTKERTSELLILSIINECHAIFPSLTIIFLLCCRFLLSFLFCQYSIIRRELEKMRLLKRYEYDSCLFHRSLDIDYILLPVCCIQSLRLRPVLCPVCYNNVLGLRHHYFWINNVLLHVMASHHITSHHTNRNTSYRTILCHMKYCCVISYHIKHFLHE